MLNIDDIRKRLEDRNLAIVANRIGCTRAHLSNISTGKTDGSYRMLKRLSDYLESEDRKQ